MNKIGYFSAIQIARTLHLSQTSGEINAVLAQQLPQEAICEDEDGQKLYNFLQFENEIRQLMPGIPFSWHVVEKFGWRKVKYADGTTEIARVCLVKDAQKDDDMRFYEVSDTLHEYESKWYAESHDGICYQLWELAVEECEIPEFTY